MQVPIRFTISPNNQTGDVYATEFEFSANFAYAYASFTWDFGDGYLEYNSSTAKHTYQYPGLYTVSLSAWTPEGFLIQDSAEVNVDYVYRDAIVVERLPSQFGVAGLPSTEPFVLSLTSAQIDQPLAITLQALNTKSVPYYAVSEKWKFITPKWRFVDANTNEIIRDAYVLSSVPLYKNSKVVAVSATASFYYIDDLASFADRGNACPLLIIATLSSAHFKYPRETINYPYFSYSNSDVTRALINWQITPAITTSLKVTENYINEVYPIKWSNVPIPVMITCKFDKSELGFTASSIPSSINSGDVLSYPKTNAHGALNTVKIVLSTESGLVPENLYTVEVKDVSYDSSDAPLYFQALDEQNNAANGYIFTTITPLTSLQETAVIAVSTVISNELVLPTQFAFPTGVPIRSNVYVSHPKSNAINKICTISFDEDLCENIQYYASTGTLARGTYETFNTPILSTASLANYTLSGHSAVYGMGYDPVVNRLYACDADDDKIHVFDSTSTLISSIDISLYTGSNYNQPSYITIDESNNIWVSLYGSQKLLKFDTEFNLMLYSLPTTFADLTAGASGSPFIEPPVIETDSNSDVWACYCHPLSSRLVKFEGSFGAELFSVDSSVFPVTSVPVSLSIDSLDNVWVACYDSNEIRCYSSVDGSLLYVIDQIMHPSYTTFDRKGRLWFTHGYNKLSVKDVLTGGLSSWEVNSTMQTLCSIPNAYTATDINNSLYLNEIWGGLAIDVFDTLWVVDSDANNVYTFSVDSPSTISVINLIPTPTSNYVVLGGNNFITTVPLTAGQMRSAQAAGDWCGNKWYQKYGNKFATFPAQGVSAPFNIYDLNNSFQITKVNEEFNTSKYFRDLALPEILNNNENLFETFLAAVAGDGNPTKEDIGRVVYERIANFVQTHGDFDTAEIPQLLSFAEQLSVKASTYGKDFPVEVNRLLNLFSVNKHYLRGQIDYEPNVSENIGAVITESDMVTANTYIVMKDILQGTYQEIYVDASDAGDLIYPLSAITIEGTKTPLLQNYIFFNYKLNELGYKNNIINWESAFTTLGYNVSSNEAWYGENGVVEILFNNLLTKKLFED